MVKFRHLHLTNDILEVTSIQEAIHDQRSSGLGEEGRVISAIYSALSDKDSLDIFCMAAGGIPAKTRVLAEHKFSRKKYYVRLKRLRSVGLVRKLGRHYFHTSLGQIIYETQINYIRYLGSPREVDGAETYFPKLTLELDSRRML